MPIFPGMTDNAPSPPSAATVVISGANRGLGLEFARQYATDGWRVMAGCRRPEHAEALQALAADMDNRVSIHPLDVRDPASVAALAEAGGNAPVDLLINCAGTMTRDSGPSGVLQGMDAIDYTHWTAEFETHVQGSFAMAAAFAGRLANAERPVIVNMSSGLGSIANTDRGGIYYYRTAKAALNMLTRNLAADLRQRGVIVVSLDPGWVRTDMGGPKAPLSPEESIAQLRRVIAGLGMTDSGRFLTRGGDDRPW